MAKDKKKFVLATTGSRGDVQPMVALALRLVAEEHEVLLCAPPNFQDWAEHIGLSFHGVGQNMHHLLFRHRANLARPLALARKMGGILRNEMKEQFETLPPLLGDADMLIGVSLFLAGPSLAEKFDIPYRHVALCPQTIPSLHHPPPIVPFATRNSLLNGLLWRVQRIFFNQSLGPVLKRERKKLGLKPVTDLFGNVGRFGFILASDAALAPTPPDVDLDVFQTGVLALAPSGELPDDLEDFLSSGSPPVYIGFGSMTVADPESTTRLLLEALSATGRRAVISRGWAGLGKKTLPENCCLAGNIPHGLLFPRMAAIIHHGGAGTVATAARAGVPQIIVPHLLDQYYWADRLHRIGISPPSIPQTSLTAKKLSSAIEDCFSDEFMKLRAQQVARELGEAEDGLDLATAYLKTIFS